MKKTYRECVEKSEADEGDQHIHVQSKKFKGLFASLCPHSQNIESGGEICYPPDVINGLKPSSYGVRNYRFTESKIHQVCPRFDSVSKGTALIIY